MPLLGLFPSVKTFGNRRAEEGIAVVNLPNRLSDTGGGGVFDQIAHRARVDRRLDIGFIAVRRKHEHFGGGDGF